MKSLDYQYRMSLWNYNVLLLLATWGVFCFLFILFGGKAAINHPGMSVFCETTQVAIEQSIKSSSGHWEDHFIHNGKVLPLPCVAGDSFTFRWVKGE